MIERACEEDVAFRVLAAQQRPDHATLARYVVRHQEAIAGLFGEVLTLCARSGLAKVGVIAVDGTKVQANASRNENLDYEQLAREILEEAKAVDAAEDELYGEARGDELPGSSPPRKVSRLVARGQAAPGGRARGEPAAGAAQPPETTARGQAPPRGGALDRGARQPRLRGLPGARADEGRAALRAPTGPLPAAGHAGGSHQPHRPRLTRRQGPARFLQGYNAQAVTNEHQVVLAAEIETVGADFGHLEPMLDATQRELAAAGIHELPEVLLADAGYWHGEQMQRIAERGIEVLIPPDTSRRRTTRRNWDGGRYDEMRQVLATDRGGELYRKRQPMIEPVFAQMKFNRGLDRFRRRGRGAVRTEWRLITATHNLLKLHRHALAAA